MRKVVAIPDRPEEYLWSFPGSPVRIHLRLSVVSRLQEHLFSGPEPDPAKIKERGGLLLGKVRPGAVEIVDFEPLISNRTDRHFSLSEFEKSYLQKTLQQWRSDDSGVSVVGYYRTDVRGSIRLSPADLDLINEHFKDPSHVFLVIGAVEHGTPEAGFFFWDGGTIFADTSFMTFPFDERSLAAQRPVISETPEPKQQIQPTAIPRTNHLSANRGKWIGLALGAIVVACSLGAYLYVKPEFRKEVAVARSIVSSPMELSASRSHNDVIVTWNSQLAPVTQARVGMLTIKDGASQSELPLTPDQLQMGKLMYAPRTDRLEVTLEVFSSNGAPTREAMMVALTQPPAERTVRARATPEASPGISPGIREIVRTTPVARTTPVEREALEDTPPDVRTFQVGAFAEPKKTPEPALLGSAPLTSRMAALSPAQVKAPDFLAPVPVQQAPPRPVENAPKPAENAPAVAVSVEPAKAVQRVRPTVAPNVIAMLKSPIDVQVRVIVDEKGKVIKAEPATRSAGVAHYLGTAASSAARLWTFQPARRGNTTVPSEVLLQFTFRPER